MGQQLDGREGEVGLGICGDLSHLLEEFLDGVVGFGDFVVFAVEDGQVVAEVVVGGHLFEVDLSAL